MAASGDVVAAEPRLTTYPHLRVDVDALDHNIATMAAWCAGRGVRLAPHVKTTMSEPIVARQAAAGADLLTVATVEQAVTVRSWGHRQILIANEVVDGAGLGRIRGMLEKDGAFRIACLVDSAAGVRLAARTFTGTGPALSVLIDVGTPGGRTGVRTVAAAEEIAALVAAAPGLRLTGVAGYEGVVGNERDAATLAAVDEHCHRVGEVFRAVAAGFETDHPLLTMGGSIFPDRVVAGLRGLGPPLVLRSGCYVTHDHGVYARVGPPLGLRPAVTVQALVLSRPEAGVAVVGAGKRELPYDAGPPVLLNARGQVSAMFDHHVVLADVEDLAVGDVAEFGISHPCSAFDRWDEYLAVRGHSRPESWPTSFRAPAALAGPTLVA